MLFLGAGLGALRTAALPKWLSIATILLGFGCLLGPIQRMRLTSC